MTPEEGARILQRHAKRFNAGAFATPSARELRASEWGYIEGDGGATVWVEKTLSRESKRTAWDGTTYVLPKQAHIVTHLGHAGPEPQPSLSLHLADVVFAYREDPIISGWMLGAGRQTFATHISAASEIKAAWGFMGSLPQAPIDAITVVPLPLTVPEDMRAGMLAEAARCGDWHDDYPFYSDGSWGALSLRGFDPGDPRWGVKPAEMGRKWNEEHPGAIDRRCGWTVLAERCPTMVDFVESVQWWSTLERVRLLRMDGRGGKGGRLGRHTDITDKAAGTKPGQVVRFHVPLVTDPLISMHSWDLDGSHHATHLDAWRTWYLDARKPHAVTNPTGTDRLHLTVDVIVDEAVQGALLCANGDV